VHTSSDKLDCPFCGSPDVTTLSINIDLYRCLECGEHFEEQDDYRPQRVVKERRMRHHKYKED